MLAEPSSDASFPDHFSGHAADYAAYRPGYPPALADALAAVVPTPDRVWDAGCGSGQLAGLLASRFHLVVGTDASLEQLRDAESPPRVHYRQELAEASSLPDASVALAAAGQAVHWFDLDGYYREVRRVVRRGGAVALITYGMVRVGPEVNRVLDRFYEEVLDDHWPPERRHVEARYRSLDFPFDPVDTPELEIREEWTLEALVGYVGTWSAVRALERAEGSGPFRSFRAELREAWGGAPDRIRALRWPLALRVGRV